MDNFKDPDFWFGLFDLLILQLLVSAVIIGVYLNV